MTDSDFTQGILEVLTRWYPDDTFSVTRAGEGSSTPVYRAEANGQVGYIRLGEHPGDRREGEITAHRYLSMFNLPIPHVLDFEYDPPELDRSIALTSSIHGVPLAELPEPESLEEIGDLAGATLAHINRVPVSGFGWVTGVTDDDMLQAEHRTRSAWAAEYVTASERVAKSDMLSPDLVPRLRSSITVWANLPGKRPASLAHGDFDSTHIYVDPETRDFTGIIDFGEIRGADPLYDLGHVLLHDGESGRPAIFPYVFAGFSRVIPQADDVSGQIRLHAVAIATRTLAIQLARPASRYRDWLGTRLGKLICETEECP